MKTRTITVTCMVLIVLFISTTPAKSSHALTPKEFRAQDGSFTIKLPSDWSLPIGQIEQFIATSPRGEIVAFGRHDVFDRQSIVRARQLLASTGVPVPPQLLQLLSQPASDPLAPVEVIRSYVPAMSPWVRNLQILRSRPLPPAFPGANGALVRYRFVFVPIEAKENGHESKEPKKRK